MTPSSWPYAADQMDGTDEKDRIDQIDQPAEAYLRLLKEDNGPGVVVDVKGVLREVFNGTKWLYWSL